MYVHHSDGGRDHVGHVDEWLGAAGSNHLTVWCVYMCVVGCVQAGASRRISVKIAWGGRLLAGSHCTPSPKLAAFPDRMSQRII